MERGRASPKLDVAVAHVDGARVMRLRGEFDLAGVAAFETALEREALPMGDPIVLDMRGLTFIDSSGLRSVLMADSRVRAEGGRCVIVRGPERVTRVLELTGVNDRLELVDRFPISAQPG
jgi:anti-anti-sigma factor